MNSQKLTKTTKNNSYLTPTECAKRLNIATVTLRKWAQQGMLEAVVTPGGHRRYAIEAVASFAEKYNLPFEHNLDETRRILIVDDDPQVCSYLQALFAKFKDLAVTEQVHDGFEAGHMLHTFKPNIVLLDLMMPGIDGYEVCHLIKSHPATRHIRVIAITGFHTEENINRITEAGAELCLPKPIDRTALLAAVGLNKYVRL
ncbi:MAG: response regulator [Candidatus Heimdallarchaeota archaeon]|nr:response regulator [Candidatus Heimdallarchaeota archaeon]